MSEKPSVEQDFEPAIRSNPSLAPVVERAAKLLAEAASETSMPARAFWTLDDSTAEPGVIVQLRDELGAISKRFSRTRLADTNWVGYEMIRFWGDLLAKRSEVMQSRWRETAAAEA